MIRKIEISTRIFFRLILILCFLWPSQVFSQSKLISDVISNEANKKLEHHLKAILLEYNNYEISNKAITETQSYQEKLKSFSKFVEIRNINESPILGVVINTTVPQELISTGLILNPQSFKADFNYFVTANVVISQLENICELESVIGIEPSYILYDELNSSIPEIKADSVWSGYTQNLEDVITGEGVYIGILEGSIPDDEHPNFWDENGNSRIKKIFTYFPWIYLEDKHATHVGGIAGGLGKQDENWKFRGVAYRADYLYGIAKIDPLLSISSSNLFIDSFNKMIEEAEDNNKPIVVNASLGTVLSPHDGKTYFEQVLDQIISEKKVVLVKSAGNTRGRGYPFYNLHYSHTIPDGGTEHTFAVKNDPSSTYADNEFEVEIWYDGNYELDVKVADPNNNWSNWIEFGQENHHVVSNGVIHIYNNTLSRYTDNGDNIIYLNFNDPTLFDEKISTGDYEISLRAHNNGNGCDIDAYNSFYVYEDILRSEKKYGISFPNGDYKQSITLPGCTNNAITVASYDDFSGNSSEFSSVGPLRNDAGEEVTKPDISAPGENITSSIIDGWGSIDGTSMAAPHVTGTIALLLQYFPELTPTEIKYILKETASDKPSTFDEKIKWGAGKLNALECYKYMVGYTYGNNFQYKSVFENVYQSSPSDLTGLPLEVVQPNWNGEGYYKQKLTDGSIFFDPQNHSDAYWLGEEIWNAWNEIGNVNSNYGLPISSEYLDQTNNNFKTVAFKNGFIWYNDLLGEVFYGQVFNLISFDSIELNKGNYQPNENALLTIKLSDFDTGSPLTGAVVSFDVDNTNYICDEISNGNYQKTFDVPSIVGNYTITILATKENYNSLSGTKQLLVVDNQLPELTIVSSAFDKVSYQPDRLAKLNIELVDQIEGAVVTFQVEGFSTVYSCEDIGNGFYEKTFRVPQTPGTYSVQIYASQTGFSPGSAILNLLVDSPIPIPVLLEPADDEENVSLRPTFKWSPVTNAEGYDIKTYEYVNGVINEIDYAGNLQTTQYTIPLGLLDYGEGYHWTVRTRFATTYGEWATSFTFDTEERLNTPILVSPQNGATNLSLMPMLEWQTISNADYYRVVVALDSLREDELDDWDVNGNTFQIPRYELEEATFYYWFVRAYMDNGDKSEYSKPFSFRTGGDIPPGSPTLLTPINNQLEVPLNPELNWEPGSGVSYTYNIQVSDDYNFNNILYSKLNWDRTAYSIPSGILNSNQEYYWRVSANNNTGSGNYSSPFSFTTTITTPEIGVIRWELPVPSYSRGVPVFDNEGFIYLADGDLNKIDPATGEIIWTKLRYGRQERDQGATISHDGEIIYTIADNTATGLPPIETDYLVALKKNGTILWYTDTHSKSVFKPALDAIGNLYLAMNDTGVVTQFKALASYTPSGQLRWKNVFATSLDFQFPPVISGDKIYLGQDWNLNIGYGYFYAFNTSNGSINWSKQLTDDYSVDEPPAISNSFLAFNTSRQEKMYVVDKNNGATLSGWPITSLDTRLNSPLIDGNNRIYSGNNYEEFVTSAYAQCLNSNGSLVWQKDIIDNYGKSGVLGDDEIFYFHNNNGNTVYAVDKNSGSEIWTLTLLDDPENMMIGPNGDLYVGVQEKLYSIKTSSTGFDKTAQWAVKYKDYQGTACYDGQDILYPPIGINASKGTYTHKIVLSWETNINYDSILVLRKIHPDSSSQILTNTLSNQYIDEEIQVGINYYYYLRAYKDGRVTLDSPTGGALGFGKWNEPHHLLATQGIYSDKIILKWSPPIETPETFQISRSEFRDSGYVLIKQGLLDTFYVNSSAPDEILWYKVRAVYGDSLSFWSQPISGWKNSILHHFKSFPKQGEPYAIVINQTEQLDTLIQTGDEFGIFDNGLNGIGLVGAIKFSDSLNTISMTSYLQTIVGTDTIPGAIEGNSIEIKCWDSSTDTEYETNLTFISGGHFGDGFASLIFNLNILFPKYLSGRVILEGAYLDSTMTTTLANNNLIPLSQPFNKVPWNYSGTETLTQIPPNVVDWILLESRENLVTSTLERRAALLKNDGKIVDLDGESNLNLSAFNPGNRFFVIYHQNHLPIISSVPIPLNAGTTILYDFTDSQTKAYTTGPNPMKDLGGGKFGMIAGDADADGVVDYEEDLLIKWIPNFGLDGYYPADFNMNGTVDYENDVLQMWLSNFGYSSQVPGVVTAGKMQLKVNIRNKDKF